MHINRVLPVINHDEWSVMQFGSVKRGNEILKERYFVTLDEHVDNYMRILHEKESQGLIQIFWGRSSRDFIKTSHQFL